MLDLVQHFFQNPSLSSNPGRPSQNLFSQRRLTEESRCPPQTILKCLKASFIASSFSEWQFSSTPSQLFLPVLILRYSSASIPMLTVCFGRGFWLINKTTVSTWLDTTGSTPNLRGVHNSTITLPKSSFEHLSFIKRRGCSPFNDCLVL